MTSINLNKEQIELAELAVALRLKTYNKNVDENHKNIDKLSLISIQLESSKSKWKNKQIAILSGCIEEYAAHSEERLAKVIDVTEILAAVRAGITPVAEPKKGRRTYARDLVKPKTEASSEEE